MQIRRIAVHALRAAADRLDQPEENWYDPAFEVSAVENSSRRIGDVQTSNSDRKGVSWVLLRPRFPLLPSQRGPELWITNIWRSMGRCEVAEALNDLLPELARQGVVPSRIYRLRLNRVLMYRIDGEGAVHSMNLKPSEARRALNGTLRWNEKADRRWFPEGLSHVFQHVMDATFKTKPRPGVVVQSVS